ncbi:MAG TPA: DUF92 domain-containing protein [Gemmatimonadaceae bacterium]|nr:DUF92 domain-containing protein [Gemmatimonadaceae bacterium]
MTGVAARAGAGLLVAAAIAIAARRARSLSTSGAVAATLVGTACVAAGWAWGGLLIAYFVASSALSRYGEQQKEARTGDVVAKGGERDATQVLANGGAFAAAALLALAFPAAAWPAAAGAGALAAAAADTWATEIGTLVGGEPRSILGGGAVPPGTSGGVTTLGTVASLAGAAFVAALAALLGFGRAAAAGAVVGGVAGSLVDSLLGATFQARRWCDRCERGTEREVHGCGTRTRPAGGVAWLDNDAVNAASALAGAALSTAVAATLVSARWAL